jgi:hypothetical protein
MKKWIVNVNESHMVEGQRATTTSSHIIEATTAFEARLLFANKAFPNERIQSVVECEAPSKKVSKPL